MGIRLKAIVVYLSTSGNTEAMAEAIASGIESRNVDVKAVSFYDVKPEELNEAEAIAIGSSTFDHKILLPPMEKFMNETLVSVNMKGKIGAAFGLSLIHISEPTRRTPISYAVFCLKK